MLLLTLLLLNSCGSGSSKPGAQLSFTPPVQGLSDQLPAVPEPVEMTMARITAAIDAGSIGALFDRAGGGAVVSGTAAVLDSGLHSASWALYSFGGVVPEAITAVNYTVSNLDSGERVFIAIADYVSNRWRFLPVTDGTTVSIPLPSAVPGMYQSPLGNSSVLLVAWGGDSFHVEQVSLTYEARNSVSGTVVDKDGNPVAGVIVSTPVGGLSTVTNASGSYTLGGLPDGSWPVLATLNGWTFYPQPAFVNVSGAAAVVAPIVGNQNGARFTVRDTLPGNDDFDTAPTWDFLADGPLHESASADDDRVDFYRFVIPTPGSYVLHFRNEARDLLAPGFAVFSPEIGGIHYAEDIYRGEVAITFAVTQPNQELRLLLQAVAGGGEYELRLSQDVVGRLGVYAWDGSKNRSRTVYEVTPQPGGLTTEYFSRSLVVSTQWALYDRAYPLGQTVVKPRLAGHTFTPESAMVDVADSSSVDGQIFGFSGPAGADSYEPNNSTGTAYNIAALPYVSAVPLSVTADNAGDIFDYYRITPAMGKGIRVKVSYGAAAKPYFTDNGITGRILNNAGDTVASSLIGGIYETPDGFIMESSELADGNPYYIVISAVANYTLPDDEPMPYVLEVMQYDGFLFQVGARVANSYLTDGVRFIVYDQNFEIRYETNNNNNDLLTVPRYVPAGTQLRMECYREGCALDRQTKSITVNANTVVYFDTPDLGADSREPNGSFDRANQLAFLPITFSASFSSLDDSGDFYKLNPVGSGSFKLEVLNANPDEIFSVVKYDHTGMYEGDFRLKGPAHSILMSNNGMPGQAFRFGGGNMLSANYTLRVSQVDAYTLSGVVRDGGAVGLNAIVVNLTTGDRAYATAGSGGAYEFMMPFEPGSYNLVCYAPGYAPSFLTDTVTITNSDATRNFITFVASSDDTYEPNNSIGTATVIALATDYHAAASGLSGDVDYFRISLNRGDLVQFKLTPDNPFEVANLTLRDQFGVGYVEDWQSSRNPDGSRFISFLAPANANYFLLVEGLDPSTNYIDAARYTLRVDKLN